MNKLGFTAQFKKDFRNLIRRGADKTKIDEVVLRLRQNIPLDNKHKDHPLNGNWNPFGYFQKIRNKKSRATSAGETSRDFPFATLE